MHLINNILLLDFFRNKEFNQLYISIFIMTFGESLINVFVPIYLFNLGIKVYEILFFYFLISFYFLLFFYLGAKIIFSYFSFAKKRGVVPIIIKNELARKTLVKLISAK